MEEVRERESSISERQFYNLPKSLLGVLGYRAPQSPVLGGILGNVVFWLNMATCSPYRKNTPPDDFTIQSAWKKEWASKEVPNKHLVSDPNQQVPGTDLPRREWSTINRFRTGHGPCLASLHRWGSSPSPLCACGEEQTMEHIIEVCPLQRLRGGLVTLHTADQEVTAWLKDFAFAK